MMNITNNGKALLLARALVKLDDDHNCRLCSKTEWGEDKHDDDCPMKMAYEIIKEAEEQQKGNH